MEAPMRSVLIPFVLSVCMLACALQHSGQDRELAAGARVSQQALDQPEWPHETTKYRCEDGTQLQVAYLNLEKVGSYAALYYDGRLSLMRPWPAASGARYVSMDEQVGLRWHTKNGRGMLSFLAADHTAEEITLLSDCRAVTPLAGE